MRPEELAAALRLIQVRAPTIYRHLAAQIIAMAKMFT